MLKNILTALFVIVFLFFGLDYFKLLPSDDVLALKDLSYRQEQEINSFSAIEKPQQSQKFTDRVSNKPKTF